MPSYVVHVVHTYFEAGDFEVEADDEEEAEDLAKELAMTDLIDPELVDVVANARLREGSDD